MNDLQIRYKTGLPCVEILLYAIAEQLTKEEKEAKAIEREAHLLNAFSPMHAILPQRSVT